LAETSFSIAAGLQPFGGSQAKASVETSKSPAETAEPTGFFAEVFHSAVRTAIENPVNSIKQFAAPGHVSNDELHLVPQEATAKFNTSTWYAQQIGSAIGMLPWYLAIRGGVGEGFKAMGVTAESGAAAELGWKALGILAGESALSGAIYEGGLKPVQVGDGHGFWQERAKNAMVGSVMFGITSGSTDAFRNVEGQVARSVLGATTNRGLISGVAGGIVGGASSMETSTLLNYGRFANSSELKQNLVAQGVIGLGMRGIELPFEGAKSSADAEGTRVQQTLSKGRLANVELREGVGGYTNKQLTFADMVGDDGHTVPVILRSLTEPSWNDVKQENGSIAHELHDRLGFTNPSSFVTERTLSLNGEPPARYLVEQRLPGGSWLEQIPKMANERFPQPAPTDGSEPEPEPVEENINKMLAGDAQLSTAMETAIAQRMLYGDLDFNSGNLMLQVNNAEGTPSYDAYNIDFKRSFTPQAAPTWAQEVMQFPAQTIGQYFSGKPLSASVHETIQTAVDRLTTMREMGDPLVDRIGAKNFDAMIGRGQSLLANGLPKCYWILDPGFETYKTEMEEADKYWKQRWPQLYRVEPQQ
jgi:hypothetical protein